MLLLSTPYPGVFAKRPATPDRQRTWHLGTTAMAAKTLELVAPTAKSPSLTDPLDYPLSVPPWSRSSTGGLMSSEIPFIRPRLSRACRARRGLQAGNLTASLAQSMDRWTLEFNYSAALISRRSLTGSFQFASKNGTRISPCSTPKWHATPFGD
jgi:hypothetical protein